jgi:hypothetical protein
VEGRRKKEEGQEGERGRMGELTITNYQLPVTDYLLPITNYTLPNKILDFRLAVLGKLRFEITDGIQVENLPPVTLAWELRSNQKSQIPIPK